MSNEVIANAGSELLESRLCSIMETLDPINDDIRQPDNGAIQEGMETANKLALEIFQDVSSFSFFRSNKKLMTQSLSFINSPYVFSVSLP